MAKRVHMIWYGRKIRVQIERELGRRLDTTGRYLKRKTQLNISRPVATETRTRRRSTSRGAAGSSYRRAIPSSRSKSGEFPKKETGRLLRSIFYKLSRRYLLLMLATSEKHGSCSIN